MKKNNSTIILSVSCFCLIIMGIFFTSYLSNKVNEQEQIIYDQIKKKEIMILNYGHTTDFGKPITMMKVEYEGHTYIIAGNHGITHDPDCPCQD